MGLEDDFLLADADDEKTIEFIKNYLPQELKEKFSDGPNLSDSANSVQAIHTSHGSALRRHTIWTPTRMAALAHS